MPTNTERLDALKDAIYSGATSITLDGQTVSYRSLAEMERIAIKLEKEIEGFSKRPKISSLSATLRSQ